MVQDSLIEYISSQLKVGIARETIRASLLGAGWVAADVEDTLKRAEGGSSAAMSAKTAAPATVVSVASAAKPVAVATFSPFTAKTNDPQSLRVSDLISISDSAAVASPSLEIKAVQKKSVTPIIAAAPDNKKIQAQPQGAVSMSASPTSASVRAMESMQAMQPAPVVKTKKYNITIILESIFLVVLGTLAGYLFFQNQILTGKVDSLTGQATAVTTEIATLKAQLSSTNGPAAQVPVLAKMNNDLLLSLSFYTVLPGMPVTPTSTTVTGLLSGNGKSFYALTTAYGVKLLIANSKDPKVMTALQPLSQATSSIDLTGTYTPGSPNLTVTAVNGAPLNPTK